MCDQISKTDWFLTFQSIYLKISVWYRTLNRVISQYKPQKKIGAQFCMRIGTKNERENLLFWKMKYTLDAKASNFTKANFSHKICRIYIYLIWSIWWPHFNNPSRETEHLMMATRWIFDDDKHTDRSTWQIILRIKNESRPIGLIQLLCSQRYSLNLVLILSMVLRFNVTIFFLDFFSVSSSSSFSSPFLFFFWFLLRWNYNNPIE